MMKNTHYIAMFALILVLISSCSRRIIIPPGQEIRHSDSIVHDSISYIEKPIQIPVVIQADSSVLEALFGCDSLNNVFIKRINDLVTKGVRVEYIFKDNTLTYRTRRDSLQTVVWALEKELKTRSSITVRDSIYIEKAPEIFFQNSKFARFSIWWFFGSLVVALIYLIFKLRLWRLVGVST